MAGSGSSSASRAHGQAGVAAAATRRAGRARAAVMRAARAGAGAGAHTRARDGARGRQARRHTQGARKGGREGTRQTPGPDLLPEAHIQSIHTRGSLGSWEAVPGSSPAHRCAWCRASAPARWGPRCERGWSCAGRRGERRRGGARGRWAGRLSGPRSAGGCAGASERTPFLAGREGEALL